jgi:hypothetical protein
VLGGFCAHFSCRVEGSHSINSDFAKVDVHVMPASVEDFRDRVASLLAGGEHAKYFSNVFKHRMASLRTEGVNSWIRESHPAYVINQLERIETFDNGEVSFSPRNALNAQPLEAARLMRLLKRARSVISFSHNYDNCSLSYADGEEFLVDDHTLVSTFVSIHSSGSDADYVSVPACQTDDVL